MSPGIFLKPFTGLYIPPICSNAQHFFCLYFKGFSTYCLWNMSFQLMVKKSTYVPNLKYCCTSMTDILYICLFCNFFFMCVALGLCTEHHSFSCLQVPRCFCKAQGDQPPCFSFLYLNHISLTITEAVNKHLNLLTSCLTLL